MIRIQAAKEQVRQVFTHVVASDKRWRHPYLTVTRTQTSRQWIPRSIYFFDERYEYDKTFSSLIVPVILVSQLQYDANEPLAQFQSKKSRLQEIDSFLDKLGGYAYLGTARLRRDEFDSDEIDRYKDAEMKRRDHVWSLVVSFTICDIIAKAIASGECFQFVDIYHDPKSLRLEHGQAWRNAITDTMVQRGRNELIEQKRLNQGRQFSIRDFREIDKPISGHHADKFQRGVWMADQLARNKDFLVSGQFSRIRIKDFSTYVEEILRGC